MNSTLVFLHAFPFSSQMWQPQVAQFQTAFNVITPDFRGHGMGLKTLEPWMIHHFAEDLKVLLNGMEIPKATLCGVSMGGYVALHFVKQYPQMVDKLILADTRGDADSNEAKDKRFATIRKIAEEGLGPFAEEFSKNALSEKTLNEKPKIQKTLEGMILENDLVSVQKTLVALAARRDSTSFLNEIKAPTLVMVGDKDKITPPEVNKALADKIPGAQFKVIEGAGHFGNLEQPEQFNRYLAEFLG